MAWPDWTRLWADRRVRFRRFSRRQGLHPSLVGFVAGVAQRLLDSAHALLGEALGLLADISGRLARLLLDLSAGFLHTALDLVAIHQLLLCGGGALLRAAWRKWDSTAQIAFRTPSGPGPTKPPPRRSVESPSRMEEPMNDLNEIQHDPQATAADVLVDTLIEWGIEVVFGLPGDGINGI